MKTTRNLLLSVIMTVFCCSLGKADNIIYSNNFALGTGVNISNTPPTVANTYAGGISSAVWQDIDGTFNTSGPLLDTGIDNCSQIDYWALPFTPQTNHVYLLTVNLTFTNNPGIAPEFGFSQLFTTNYSGDARFNGGTSGYDWMAPTEANGNVQYFSGPKANSPAIASINGIFPVNTASTNTFQILLDTRSALWSVAGYCNGIQAGNSLTYSVNPSNLVSVGISQNGTPTLPTAIQYNTFVLTTTLQPFITTQPTVTTTLGSGSAYTNSVTVTADTNGGTLYYQWYANSLPLTNGVNNVSGANTNKLVINPVTTPNQASNYYVIVTNSYGSATSSLANLTVLTNPVPVTTGGPITLFTGSGGNVGSSPAFSITAVGAPPLMYQWLTNGVAVAGATNTSLAFTNLQSGSPATYACIVSNGFGPTNVTWSATYVTAPTAAYPQTVLGDIPLDLWRLNETNDGSGNEGAVTHDYQSGNNGYYTNVTLAQTGYNGLEPAETSMAVTAAGTQPSCVKQIANVDLAATMTNGVNAEFTVEAWASCISGNGSSGGAPVVSQGTFGASSFFLGVDTSSPTKHYQFYVRNAAGTLYSADSTIQANDQIWHHLVGVCDEAHSNVSLYIDGQLAASASIPPGSGVFESGMPVAIGAGIRAGASDYNVPFTGTNADVAIYNHALSIGQVINHFVAANNNTVPISFVSAVPPTNFPYLANQTLTIAATLAGSGPIGYYWTNVTTGSLISSGTTTNTTLNATLSIPNASTSLSGDQLELVATNPVSSTNVFLTLFNPPPPVTLDYTNPILYSNLFNGGTWSIAGMPLTAANVLVGGTNTTWIDTDGTNDTGLMQASGISATTIGDSWVVPFTPHAGYVYTITTLITFSGTPSSWTGPGFAQLTATNVANGSYNHNVTGFDWPILTESSGNVQYFLGPSTGTQISSKTLFTNGIGTHTVQVILDTSTNFTKPTVYCFVDGNPAGTNSYSSIPAINVVGIQQNALTGPNFIQWDSFELTQVAPGGVPPYLLNPLPPTNNITLTNGTVAISATAFGSAPFGYYWSNNATVIASGSTNSMAPFPANLSVSSSSLSAGPLQLVVTNAYGTNITTITLVNPINPNPGPIQYSVAGNLLTLSWPTNLGWTLQAQTNSLPTGIRTNWVNVANSSTTNQVMVPMSPTNSSVFYRLILP
jgi:hypothetical protein